MKKILLLFIIGISFFGFSQTPLFNLHEANGLKPIKNTLNNNPNLFYLDANKTINLPVDGGFLYSSLNPESGIISSGYNNNEDYVLTIKNQYNRKIFLRNHYFSSENKNDVLTIYDGQDTTAKVIKSISGYLDENIALMSSGEFMTIRFKSNNSITSKGFRFRLDNGPGVANKPASPLPNPMACAATPASDDCVNAPLICDLNGYCGNTSGAYTAGNTSGLGNFCGSIENNSWLSFVASGTTASLAFNSAGCQDNSSGIQAVIYASSNCSSFTEVSNCESQGSGSGTFTITTNVNLVPGQTYYVMVDGFAGNVCSYTVGAQSGVALGQQLTGPNQLCPGFSGVLGASSTASSYSWASTPPGVYPNTQSITITPTVTTTYTLTMGPSACTPTGITIVKTVTVTNTLNPANITAPNPICMGTNITLSSLTNGGTYAWTGPGGYNANTQNPSVPNWTSANDGIYTLVITYGPGCATSPATVNLAGTASPTINITAAPSLTVCSGQSVFLTSSGGTGTSGYTWSWNPLQTSGTTEICLGGPSPIPIICNPNPFPIPGLAASANATFTPNQSTQICVSGNNSAGCGDSYCTNIVVLPAAPGLTISPTATICPGQTTPLTISGGSTYTWSPSATLSSANGASVTASPTLTTIYTVSTTVCGGSVATKTVQVTVNGSPPTIGSITGPTALCANSTGVSYSVTNVASTSYTWSVPAGATIATGAGTNAITVNFGASAGTVSVVAVGACGTASAAITVSLTPALSLSITPNNPTICSGGSTTLTASGATNYTWSPAGTLSSPNGTNVTASPTITTVYTIIGATGTCTGSTTSTVTVSGALSLSVTPSNPTICSGGSTTLTASGATNYTWSPAGTLSSSNGPTVTASPTITTVYTILGASGTCTGSTTSTVTVGSALSLTITPNNPTICSGGSTTLTASGATNYTWSPAITLSSPNGTSVASSPTITTVYTILGASGTCTGSTTSTVTVAGALSLTVTPSTSTICPGAPVVLTASGATNYTWSPATSLSSPNGTSVTATPTISTIYTIIGATGTCTGTATASIFATGSISAVITATTPTGCGVNTGGATVTATGGTLYTYTWSPSGGSTAGVSNLGSGNNTVTVTDVSGCTATAVANITSTSGPTISVVSQASVNCFGTNTGSATVNATGGTGPYTYTWSPGNLIGASQPSLSAGIYTVIVKDVNQCSGTETVSITEPASITGTISTTPTGCGNSVGSATITASGGTPAYTYSWSPTIGSGTSISALGVGSYSVKVTDSKGCSVTLNTSINTSGTGPSLSVSSQTNAVCFSSTNAGASISAVGSGPFTYSWSPVGGNTSTATGLSGGTYTVSVSDASLCVSTITISITQPPAIVVTVTNTTASCGNYDGSATVLATGGTGSLTPLWSVNSNSTTVIGLSAGTYSVLVTDATGCTGSAITNVNSVGTLTVNVDMDATIHPGESAPLTAFVPNGATVIWTPTTGLSCSTCSNTTASPTVTTEYCIYTYIGSCADTSCVTITVDIDCATNSDYSTPNAFSPNSDGINDEFCLQGWAKCATDFHINVFNRWGEKVFSSDDPAFCWDGTYMGNPLNSGVFAFYIKATIKDVGEIVRKGNITLVK